MNVGVFWSEKVCAAVVGATRIGRLSLLVEVLLMFLVLVLLPVLGLWRHSVRRLILVDWLVVLLLMVARCTGVSCIVLLVAILMIAVLICVGVSTVVVLVSGSSWLVVLVVAVAIVLLVVVRPLASAWARVATGTASVATTAARIWLLVPVVGEASASVSATVVSSKIPASIRGVVGLLLVMTVP